MPLPDEKTPPSTGEAVEEEEDGNIFSHYYGQLGHQQNMLTDHVRTATYQNAIFSNTNDFQGSSVLDVGTGSGILAFFSVQAGARKVYGVEMSRIALSAKRLVKSNGLKDKITILMGKMEEVVLPEKVDCIVSEPLGFLLVHERMLESYIVGRDKWLKPGGKMFPSNSTIFLQPFTDQVLYDEQKQKADFWACSDFYSVDLRELHDTAMDEHFSQPVVGYFHPSILISREKASHFVDFHTISLAELRAFEIPFCFVIDSTSICHGIACWFDCDFTGSQATIVLSTGPEAPGTHWYQCRLLFRAPLAVNRGQTVTGLLKFKANKKFSYDIDVHAEVEGCTPVIETNNVVHLQDQHYHYLTSAASAVDAQGAGHVMGNLSQV